MVYAVYMQVKRSKLQIIPFLSAVPMTGGEQTLT